MATTTEEHEPIQDGSIADEHDNTLNQDSAIAELQAALGSLLLTKRDKNEIPFPPASTGYQSPPPEEPYVWTGSLKLFDFPRELRDEIYRHVLHRPDGVYHTAHVNRGSDFWWNRGRADDIPNLFLVSKQVYQEAFETFCRCNTVILSIPYCSQREGLAKPLWGQLRLFPERAAKELTQVKDTYHDMIYRPSGPYVHAPSHASIAEGGDGTEEYRKDNSSGETFCEILRDAHVFQDFFPKLRVFHASWHPRRNGPVDHCTEVTKSKTDREELIAIWLGLMREWLQSGNVVPLACVRFSFKEFVWSGYVERLDEIVNEAYQKVVREWKAPGVDVEDSGRLWLEEMDKEQTSKEKKMRRRKKKAKQCT